MQQSGNGGWLNLSDHILLSSQGIHGITVSCKNDYYKTTDTEQFRGFEPARKANHQDNRDLDVLRNSLGLWKSQKPSANQTWK